MLHGREMITPLGNGGPADIVAPLVAEVQALRQQNAEIKTELQDIKQLTGQGNNQRDRGNKMMGRLERNTARAAAKGKGTVVS